MSEEILANEVCDELTLSDADTDEPITNEIEEREENTEDIPELTDSEPEGESSQDESREKEAEADDPQETVESLKAELQALREDLEARRATFERMSAEIGEFSELFPSVPLSSIPDSVWQSVKGGVPLAASYALYEKKTSIMLDDAKRANEKNSARSTGPMGTEASSDFFSPDEVRAMSRDEVRSNYKKIMDSMKKWN